MPPPDKNCNCQDELEALQSQNAALETTVTQLQSDVAALQANVAALQTSDVQQWNKVNCLVGLYPSGSCS